MSTNTLRAKKSLGQHFLHSPSALKKIIDAAKLSVNEVVLEIGPGTGILTRSLLDTGATVVAIEKDVRALEVLSQKFAKEIENKKLKLIIGDVLEQNLSSLSAESSLKEGEYALVANIPYYITGAILEKFLEYSPRPNRMVLLVQKEVAERIVARDKKESILSVSVKVFGVPKVVAIVPRVDFVPPPTVDSAILAIENISAKNLKNVDISRFFAIVKAGFAHKRKYVKRNLENLTGSFILTKEEIEKIWNNNKISEKIRAEDMLIDQWIDIAKGK